MDGITFLQDTESKHEQAYPRSVFKPGKKKREHKANSLSGLSASWPGQPLSTFHFFLTHSIRTATAPSLFFLQARTRTRTRTHTFRPLHWSDTKAKAFQQALLSSSFNVLLLNKKYYHRERRRERPFQRRRILIYTHMHTTFPSLSFSFTDTHTHTFSSFEWQANKSKPECVLGPLFSLFSSPSPKHTHTHNTITHTHSKQAGVESSRVQERERGPGKGQAPFNNQAKAKATATATATATTILTTGERKEIVKKVAAAKEGRGG